MATRLYLAHLDLNQNQLLNASLQVLGAHPSTPVSGQIWYRSDLSNGTGNGVVYFRDASGNNIALATGGAALSSAYATLTDGTTPASASGADTFKVRAAGTGLSVATQSNDATHGDNILYTLDSATSGNNKVLLTNGSGKILATVVQEVIALADLTDVTATTGTGTTVVLTGSPTITTPILSGTPTNTNGGQIGYASTDLQFGDGTVVQTVVTTAKTQTLNNKTLTTPTIASFTNATHNHQSAAGGGTLLAACITDFDTQVRTSRLDQMAAPTASVSLNSQKITNLLDPTAAQDAATKAYVDAAINGLDWKSSARAATTANITTLSGGAPNTLDGVTLAANDRILVKDQSTGSQNGIYTVTTLGTGVNGTWTRATDCDANAEVTAGMAVFIAEGTVNGDNAFVLTTNDAIVVGTTALVFTQFNGAGQITAGAGLTKTGNTLDVVATNATIVVAADSIGVSGSLQAVHTAVLAGSGGYLAVTGAGTVAVRSITVASSSRITVSNSNGVSGDTTLDLASVVTAGTGIITTYDVYGRITSATDLIGSGGIPARTGTNTYAARTITGNAGRIVMTNGDGVAGNPTIDLATGVATPGTYDSVTVDTYGRVTAGTTRTSSGSIGNGTATSITYTHSLGTTDVIVAVYDNTTPFAEVYPEVRHASTTTIILVFNVAPTSNQYRVVVRA